MANKKTKIRIMLFAIDARGHQHEVEDFEAEIDPSEMEKYKAEQYFQDNLDEMCASGFALDDVINGYFPFKANLLFVDIYQMDADGNEIPDTRTSYGIYRSELAEKCKTLME